MAQFDRSPEKLDFTYPGTWIYSIIGKSEQGLKNAVKNILPDREYKLAPSNTSKSGKYFSMKLEVIVKSEEERNKLFKKFQQNPDIAMVL